MISPCGVARCTRATVTTAVVLPDGEYMGSRTSSLAGAGPARGMGVSSLIGRATASKAVRCGFESLPGAFMKQPSPENLAVLAQQDMATLAVWWCQLNRFESPAELAFENADPQDDGGERWTVMSWIGEAVGYRELLREWNRDRMNDEEFNDFWRAGEGHKPSKERYERLLKEQVEQAEINDAKR